MFYGIPTGWSHAELDRCLTTIKKHDTDACITIVNNNPNFNAIELVLEKHKSDNLAVFSFGTNIGVAAAWNFAIKDAFMCGYDRAVILNDDIYFGGDQFLHSFSLDTQNKMTVCSEFSYACFCMTKTTYDLVGEFDEANFAYYEDNDYAIRCTLAGIEHDYVTTNAFHGDDLYGGSRTIRNSAEMNSMNMRCFPQAQKYYIDKWGGLPGDEKFTKPWNGQNSSVMGSIEAWEKRLI